MNKKFPIWILLFGLMALWPSFPARASDFNQLYSPLISPGQWLYTSKFNYFTMWEKGHHGSASFDAFYSNPNYYSITNAIRFSPALNWDVQFSYEHTLPANYIRITENSSNVVTSNQRYFLENGGNYTFNLRYRGKQSEYYLDFLEKRYKTSWNFASNQITTPIFFNYFHSHYEDLKVGARMLSKISAGKESLFDRPLVDDNQLNTEWEVGYKNGRLDRTGTFYIGNDQNRAYYQTTRPHYLPKVNVRYGLSSDFEIESGFTYATPYKHTFTFNQYRNLGATYFLNGTFNLDENVEVPVKLRYRPSENMEFLAGFDYHYLNQSFESWEKTEANVFTQFPTKKLSYYNWVPELELNYIATPENRKEMKEIESITKELLEKKQWALSFKILQDITILGKNDANGPLNVADPYNIYLYPVENFVAGSQYSAFFTGNVASNTSNVSAQNYLELAVEARRGMTENWEVGFKSGYRGPSLVHQYAIGDKSDRYLSFKSFYYMNLSTDLIVKKDNMFSFQVQMVPDYDTVLKSSAAPKLFKEDTKYLEASLTFKKLF